METSSYCREVSAWLDPSVIIQSGLRYFHDKENATTKQLLVLTSPVLDTGTEGNLYELVKKFLSDFMIPRETLQLLRIVVDMPDESWQWLEKLRFNGTIEIDPVFRSIPSRKAVLGIREADAVVDILSQPLQMLVQSVSNVAEHWKKTTQIMRDFYQKTSDHPENFGSSLFLQHSSNGQLGVYLESQVAKAYGVPQTEEAGMIKDYTGPYMDYRAVNAYVPSLPIDPQIIETAKIAARSMALSTLQPIQPRNKGK